MNKTLTGLFIVVLMTANVFADDVLFLNNQTFANSCNVLNLGVYDGFASMIPRFVLTTYVCSPGYYLPKDSEGCARCSENSYCVGGTFQYDTDFDQGIAECPNSWYSPKGTASVDQCGHILHIGDNIVYLRSVKQTVPSLNVRIGNDIFYGNMTTDDVVMHSGTERKLKVRVGDVIYSVYDDTVDVEQQR